MEFFHQQEDEADLDLLERDTGGLRSIADRGVAVTESSSPAGSVVSGAPLAAGGKRKDHHKGKQKRKKLLHFSPPKVMFI